jgi:hypothetical protein
VNAVEGTFLQSEFWAMTRKVLPKNNESSMTRPWLADPMSAPPLACSPVYISILGCAENIVFWSPSDNNEVLTKADVVLDFPELIDL